jgi:hypothetical protein
MTKKAIQKYEVPERPKEALLEKRTAPILKQCHAFTAITSEDHYLAAGALIQRIDDAAKWIEAVGRPFVLGLDRMHKAGVAWLKKQTVPLADQKSRLLSMRMSWKAIEEKKREEAAAKVAEALRKKQQQELGKMARAAEKKGDTEQAEVLREQAAEMPLPFIDTGAQIIQEGFYVKERWVFEVTDPDKVPREFCSPDDKKIRAHVDAYGPTATIAGVQIKKEVKEHSRSVAS